MCQLGRGNRTGKCGVHEKVGCDVGVGLVAQFVRKTLRQRFDCGLGGVVCGVSSDVNARIRSFVDIAH